MRPTSIATIPYRFARYAWRTWRDARPAARKHGISVRRIVREQIALKRATGLRPDEYYKYGFDDPNVPWEEKLTVVGGDRLGQLWYLLTPRKYHVLYKNKLVFKRLFGGMGFPLAKLHGIYDPDTGLTSGGAPLRNAEDIAAWMRTSGVEDCVFKPVESAEGRMVLVMRGRKPGDPARFLSLAGEEYSPERLVAHFHDPVQLRGAIRPRSSRSRPRPSL